MSTSTIAPLSYLLCPKSHGLGGHESLVGTASLKAGFCGDEVRRLIVDERSCPVDGGIAPSASFFCFPYEHISVFASL